MQMNTTKGPCCLRLSGSNRQPPDWTAPPISNIMGKTSAKKTKSGNSGKKVVKKNRGNFAYTRTTRSLHSNQLDNRAGFRRDPFKSQRSMFDFFDGKPTRSTIRFFQTRFSVQASLQDRAPLYASGLQTTLHHKTGGAVQ